MTEFRNKEYLTFFVKISKVARLEKEYFDSTRELNRITDQVNKLESSLADLARKLDTALTEKTKIEQETAIMERRLIAADKLINGLSSENKRLLFIWIRGLYVLVQSWFYISRNYT